MECWIVITSAISGYCGFVLPEMRRDLTDGLAEDLSIQQVYFYTTILPWTIFEGMRFIVLEGVQIIVDTWQSGNNPSRS